MIVFVEVSKSKKINSLHFLSSKVGCIFLIVVYMLPRVGTEQNDHREGTGSFTHCRTLNPILKHTVVS